MTYVNTEENPADTPSRHLSPTDCKLLEHLWFIAEREFGGVEQRTCDLMALDSNAKKVSQARPLPHYTMQPFSKYLKL